MSQRTIRRPQKPCGLSSAGQAIPTPIDLDRDACEGSLDAAVEMRGRLRTPTAAHSFPRAVVDKPAHGIFRYGWCLCGNRLHREYGICLILADFLGVEFGISAVRYCSGSGPEIGHH